MTYRYDPIAGVELLGQSLPDGRVTFTQPLVFLPAVMYDGQTYSWSNVPATAIITVPEVGSVNGQGSDSGSVTVNGIEALAANGLYFRSALKVTIDHSQHFTGSVQGQTGSLDDHFVETAWLVHGVGPVKLQVSQYVVVNYPDGSHDTSSDAATVSLTGASLMPAVAGLSGSALSIPGTSSNDTIEIWHDAGALWACVNGIGKAFADGTIASINVTAAAGDDLVSIGPNVIGCSVIGGGGNDTLIGGAGDDSLTGGPGDDSIAAAGGNDQIRGAKGNDVMTGGPGDDQLFGGAGSNVLGGGKGDDTLTGNVGPDTLIGAGGDDIINAPTAMNDWIDGGGGTDQAYVLSGNNNTMMNCESYDQQAGAQGVLA
jgi:hypothetical protein